MHIICSINVLVKVERLITAVPESLFPCAGTPSVLVMEMNEMLVRDSLPRSRFLDDTQPFWGGALRDIQKTAARETSICLQSDRKFYESY